MTVEQPESREPTIFNSLFVLLLVGIFLFVALLYRQDDLSLLAILILVVVGGAKAWTAMSATRIRWDSAIDNDRVFPGESITLAMTVENGKWLPVWLKIKWFFDGALEPVADRVTFTRQEAAVLPVRRLLSYGIKALTSARRLLPCAGAYIRWDRPVSGPAIFSASLKKK
jgi:hypothetical protein